MNTQTIRHYRFLAALVIALASVLIGIRPAMTSAQGTTAPANQIEVYGTISASQANTMTVAGFVVNTTGAQINSPLAIGTLVEIEGTVLANRTIQAREVNVPDLTDDQALPSGALELKGTLDVFASPVSATVSGLAFSLAGAEIQSGLAVGNMVKIEALRAADGTWIAWELKAFDGELNGGSSSDDSSGARLNCRFEVKAASANLRSGPGTGYSVIGTVARDAKFAVLTIDPTAAWVHVAAASGQTGWLATTVGEIDDDCRAGTSFLPVFDDHGGRSGSDDDSSGSDDSDDDSGDDHGGRSGSDDSSGDDHGGRSGDDDSGGDDHGGRSGDSDDD